MTVQPTRHSLSLSKWEAEIIATAMRRSYPAQGLTIAIRNFIDFNSWDGQPPKKKLDTSEHIIDIAKEIE